MEPGEGDIADAEPAEIPGAAGPAPEGEAGEATEELLREIRMVLLRRGTVLLAKLGGLLSADGRAALTASGKKLRSLIRERDDMFVLEGVTDKSSLSLTPAYLDQQEEASLTLVTQELTDLLKEQDAFLLSLAGKALSEAARYALFMNRMRLKTFIEKSADFQIITDDSVQGVDYVTFSSKGKGSASPEETAPISSQESKGKGKNSREGTSGKHKGKAKGSKSGSSRTRKGTGKPKATPGDDDTHPTDGQQMQP
jgi:hypothetical protein